MCRRGLGLVLWLSLASGVWPAQMSERPAALPELPQIAFDSMPERTRAAIREAYAAAATYPPDPSSNGRLGMFLHAHDLVSEAEVCYRRAHLLDPASFQWTYYLGLAQAEAGKLDTALATLREATRLNPDYVPLQLKLGGCLLALGRWQEAAQVYEAILEKHAGNAAAYYGLGRVRAARKDLDGAVELLRKACEAFPHYGAVYYALAQTYKRQGKMDEAVAHLTLYQRYRTLGPDLGDRLLAEIRALNTNPSEQIRLGEELARQGRLEEAAAALERALQLDPQLVAPHISLVSLYGRLGQFAKGEEHFQAAVGLDPKGAACYFSHGLLVASQGRYHEAEEEFRKALGIDPHYSAARANLGYALEAQNRLPEAIAEFRKAIEHNPDDFQAHFGLGRILVNQESYREGIQHLLKCLEASDEESKPAILYALGAAYARSGDMPNGFHYLRLAREQAAAWGQTKLVESIDDDLRILETEGMPQ